MDERTAFVGRELLRALAEGRDVDAALQRLSEEFTSGGNARALAHVKWGLDVSRGARFAGDGVRDWLRVAVRTAQLIREHRGQPTPQIWTEMERQFATSQTLTTSLSQNMVQTLALSAIATLVALGVALVYIVFVLPQFQATFAGLGAELPRFTTTLLGGGGALLLALFVLIVLAFVGLPLKRSWMTERRSGVWLLDLFARRAIFGRELADSFRKQLFVSYAVGLRRGGLPDELSLTLASQEAGIYRDLDFWRSTPSNAQSDPLLDALLSAARLGHLQQELEAQVPIRVLSLNESAERMQMLSAFIIRSLLYVLVGALVFAMYLPIFSLGAAI